MSKVENKERSLQDIFTQIKSAIHEDPGLFAVNYTEEWVKRQDDTQERVMQSVNKANANLEYLFEAIPDFKAYFEKCIARPGAVVADDARKALLEGKPAYSLRLFGYGNEPALSVVISDRKIILVRHHYSDELKLEYYRKYDSLKYADQGSLNYMLDQFATPAKLLETLVTIFELRKKGLICIN